MRVAKKPKNPTFNELYPVSALSQNIFLFDFILIQFAALIYKMYGVDENDDEQAILKASFEMNFRLLHGEREIDKNFYQYIEMMGEDSKYIMLSQTFNKFSYKWQKLLDNVYSQTYNPLENYDRQEDTSLSYEGSENVTRNVDSDRKIKGTTADTRNDTSSAESSSQKNVFAFDSSTASPSDSDSGTTTATGTGSSNSTVDNSDVEKRTETEGHSFNDRKNVTASRIHGNIGVTTSQQMLESEVAFRMKHDFFDTVYEDIANTLLKPIY